MDAAGSIVGPLTDAETKPGVAEAHLGESRAPKDPFVSPCFTATAAPRAQAKWPPRVSR